MPVHHTRRREVYVAAWEELHDRFSTDLRTASSLFRREDLPARVSVPVGARPGFETESKCTHVG